MRMRYWLLLGLALLAIVYGLSLSSAALTDSINAYYKSDTGSGTTLYDALGRNNRTITSAASGKWINGIIDGAFDYDSAAYVQFASRLIPLTGQFTIAAWVNITNSATNDVFVSQHAGSVGRMQFGETSNKLTFVLGAGGIVAQSPGSIAENQWTQVAVTRNSTNGVTLYINGTAVAHGLNASALDNTFTRFGRDVATQKLAGGLDEIGIWNRSLTATEIASLYSSHLGFQYPFTCIGNVDVCPILDTPPNGGSTGATLGFFNSTLNPISSNLTNATLFVWNNTALVNSTTNVLSGNVSVTTNWNIPGLTIGNYSWNVLACALNSTGGNSCTWAINNFTFDYSYTVNSQTASGTVVSQSLQEFILNTTLISGLGSSQAYVNYNNSRTLATKSTIGSNTIFSTSFNAPDVDTSVNISYFWELVLQSSGNTYDFNLTSQTQQIIPLQVDNCSSYTLLILNYTLLDEEAQTALNDNVTIEVDAVFSDPSNSAVNSTFSTAYNSSNARICMASGTLDSSSYRLDVLTSYVSQNHVQEFHNIQNFSLTNSAIPQNINLYDLLTADSQEFKINFKDADYLPVKNALFDITRKYISQGVFRSVEVPKTDTDGNAIAHLVLSNVIYTIIVSKNGAILGTFDNIIPTCDNQATGDCKINLRAASATILPIDFSTNNNVSYTLTYNSTTKVVQSIFSTTDGSSITMLLNVTLFDNFGSTSVCADSLTTSGGTLSCTVPSAYGNSTILATLYKNGLPIASKIISTQEEPGAVFGATRVILVLILFTILPLLGLTSGPATLVLGMLGLLSAALLNFYSIGSILGVGATILWAIIAGGILLWKVSNR